MAGAVLMDLSKAFDCLPHIFLLAKLKSYGFSDNAIEFMYSYLDKRVQRVKINSGFSDWMERKQGVTQGSILGPLLFNIYITNIFLHLNKSNLCNYADDNTIWLSSTDMNELTDDLESEAAILNKWFYENFLLLNGDKSKPITSKSNRSNLEESKIQINGSNLIESKNVKLLRVTLDHQLRLEEHIKVFCKEAGKKVNALARIASYMDESKRILLMKTFILPYLNYCPLIWMFCSRKSNSRINRIHERAMRTAHYYYE